MTLTFNLFHFLLICFINSYKQFLRWNSFQLRTLFRTRLRTSGDVVAAGGSLISRVRLVRSPRMLLPHAESFGRRGGERRRPMSNPVRRWETSREVPAFSARLKRIDGHPHLLAWLFDPRACVCAYPWVTVVHGREPRASVVITGR